MYLMHKNTPVLFISEKEDNFIKVLNEKLVPFLFKNNIQTYTQKTDNIRYEAREMQRVYQHNYNLFVTWLSWRTLILSQKYAKKLYQAYRLEQRDDPFTRAKLALTYKALSLSDDYWVTEDTLVKWGKINIRHNSLQKAIAQIQLHGHSMTLNGKPEASAFSTTGAYRPETVQGYTS